MSFIKSGVNMSGNLYGSAFRVMTFGESHGPYIGVVIDGLAPGLDIDLDSIQEELNRRRPGQSNVVTPRKEEDTARIISGVLEGKTTGTPVCILIKNQDPRSQDYRKLQRVLRPGHASFTFLQKYGVFDYRGGGRASGRETATRVAAGAVAKIFLMERGIDIFAYTRQIGDINIRKVEREVIETNPVRCPDSEVAQEMIEAILKARDDGDSLGGVVEIVVKNCPAGLGEPVFNKLEADLAQALMSIGAIKAFEMGSGFQSAQTPGSLNNDLFYYDGKIGRFRTRTNHAGGVLGGITNGEDLIMRIAVKPPSSIGKSQETVDQKGNAILLETGGRHDPCICPRVVPVAEAMVALVLLDHLLMQERLNNQPDLVQIRDRIDTIDAQLLLLLAQRRHNLTRIAELKKSRKKPVFDNKREAAKTRQWVNAARELNLPVNLLETLLQAVLEDSHAFQREKIK